MWLRRDGIAWVGAWIVLLSLGGMLPAARGDAIDTAVEAAMKRGHICALSLAIVDGGGIVRAQGYGTISRDSSKLVTESTLFQAASVSKPLAAMGALWLVQQGQINLDDDVNLKLVSWKVPENAFTARQKVTLRELLSHTAGTNVHGFPGYFRIGPIPTLADLLDGLRPCRSPAIRVEATPGTAWRYSGGGYTIVQQLVIDVSRQPFPEFMSSHVLTRLKMKNSTFEQPLSGDKAAMTAVGYLNDGKPIRGDWHVYPNLAAGGLWTTPTDLAKFEIEIQDSLAGYSNKVLNQSMTREMLTPILQDDGMGLFIEGKRDDARFWHSGRHDGFDSYLIAYEKRGQGAAIMLNCNDDTGAVHSILQAIARQYHWLGYARIKDPTR
jgi:CubicO group peptidase (beta-lactamase class C family)